MRSVFAMLLMLPLGACVVQAPPPPDMTATCGAEGLQGLVGQQESVLATMRFGQPVRIIRPGMAVTMDYRPDRLNIEVDASGRIIRVHCS